MEFYNILINAHKGFAYLELLLVAAFFILLLVTMFGKAGQVSNPFRKVTLFTMIFFHVQFLLGIALLFTNVSNGLDMGAIMKNAPLRFQYVEHPTAMLIAAVIMTIINKKVKTSERIAVPVVSLGLVAIALFVFAFPWTRVFG